MECTAPPAPCSGLPLLRLCRSARSAASSVLHCVRCERALSGDCYGLQHEAPSCSKREREERGLEFFGTTFKKLAANGLCLRAASSSPHNRATQGIHKDSTVTVTQSTTAVTAASSTSTPTPWGQFEWLHVHHVAAVRTGSWTEQEGPIPAAGRNSVAKAT